MHQTDLVAELCAQFSVALLRRSEIEHLGFGDEGAHPIDLRTAGDCALDAVWRALLAGIVVNIVVWRCAIVVWRHIILSEIRHEEEARAERRRQERERMEANTA